MATKPGASPAAQDAAGSKTDSRPTMVLENTEKRDTLQATERKYQKLWQDEKTFEADAPSIEQHPLDSISAEELRKTTGGKFFGTMAYPYVNGSPHLGHAFTVSKVEFASRVARAQGKRTLYPQGFHATGLPIKASADKLVWEQSQFGKNFENYTEDIVPTEAVPAPSEKQTKEDVTKHVNQNRSKQALKGAKAKYQFQVMLALGIPKSDLHLFADPQHWLDFFPGLWKQHLTDMGCSIDWRRAFITTDANLYYDSFVRWQINRLKALNKIKFGKRYTVYSPKDAQPCLDHDRSVGEGVLVQEYTGIKCKVLKWSEQAQSVVSQLPTNSKVYMVAATLRPETMYGQTNLYVSPKITYGIFHVADDEYFFISNRAARNLAFQGVFPNWGKFPKIAEMKGSDVIGTLLHAPLSVLTEGVYVVPMDTIKEAKGTAVVTSVPSDSPDDYAMTMELSKKPDYYGIKAEWVPTDIKPIIEIPGHGNLIAPSLVKQMKINSPKDATQLAEAKEQAYKLGFYQGKMIFGEFAGKSVEAAKGLVRQSLLDSNDAVAYCEPDGLAVSRSGDECVAAYLDQWYLTYGDGDDAWRQEVLKHVRGEDGEGFNSFSTATKNAIEQTLGWLNQWSVTRQYGLGTELPWDPTELVEGLSDSTIYMAYYTVAHYLHSDIFGKQPGIATIKPEQMTEQVWDYVFAIEDKVTSDIDQKMLESMRREFMYWYPLDVRISGKDLVNNHLIFFLYVHQAIWKSKPEYLPRGIRMNGHVTLNGEKMSKSTGNFLTLDNAVRKFGADATRIALADGGDGVEDANFEESTANAIILKLYELRKWIEDVIGEVRLMKDGEDHGKVQKEEKIRNADIIQREGQRVFWDELFDNEMNTLAKETIQHYEATNYKNALRTGYYDFSDAKDRYRLNTTSAGVGMHNSLIRRYAELQALLICIIAPHWADYVWRDVLKHPMTIQKAVFPIVSPPDPSLTATSEYIRTLASSIGSAEGSQQRRLAKGKNLKYDPKSDKRLTIFVAKSWPSWQGKYVDIVRDMFTNLTLDMKELSKKIDKPDMKKAMPFIQGMKKRLESGEAQEKVFNRDLGFDEVEVLREVVAGLKATVIKLKEVQIVVVDEDGKAGKRVDGAEAETVENLPQAAAAAEPGSPSFDFVNI